MITDGKKWHYLAVKTFQFYLEEQRKEFNNNRDFICLDLFYSLRTKNKLKKHKNISGNHDCCYKETPKEYNNKLKSHHREKSLKFPFITYADME